MTKKKTKDSNTDIGSNDRKRHEQPLQAVVLAADWETTSSSSTSATAASSVAFQPLILDQPKVLCPFVNQTMIDYVIQYLCNQGVQEVYIVCVSYEVENYINQIILASTTSTSSSNVSLQQMKIIIIRDMTISNDGDALREMEKRNVIQSDPFILMYGDCITNISLNDPIQQYQKQRSIDTSTILFMLLKPLTTSSSSSSLNSNSNTLHSTLDDVVIGFNNTPSTTSSTGSTSSSNVKRILLYDNHRSRTYVQYPCSFMNTICTEMDIYTNNTIYDIKIDLCSPELLIRFSDEFDYQNIRNEFITNTVLEEEIGLQQSIYGYIISNNEYGSRIYDLRTYHIISKDILCRYVYPTVPDNVAMITTSSSLSSASIPTSTNLTTTTSSVSNLRYTIQKHFLYLQYESYVENNTNYINNTSNKSTTTRIGRTSTIHGPGLIGYNCHIGENCMIRSCIIGKYNTIHDHCTIIDTHIWDNVIIESNVTIQQCMIGHNVIIKSGVTILRGCIIGNNCIIGQNIIVSEYTRLTCSTKDISNDEFDNNSNNNYNDNDWDTNDNDNDNELDDKSPDSIPTATVSDDDNDDNDNLISDLNIVGADGKGRVWKLSSGDDDAEDDDDDDDEEKIDIETIMKSQCIGSNLHDFYIQRKKEQQEDDHDSLSVVDDDEFGNSPDFDNNDNDNDDDDEYYYDKNVNAPISTNKAATIIGRQDGVDVVNELKLICLEYETSDSTSSTSSSMENLGIELNSYKFSQNATYSDCTMAIIMAIIEKMNITLSMSDGKLVSEFKCMIEKWSSLLHKMCIGIDEEKAIILGLERCAIDDTSGTSNDNKNNKEQQQQQQYQKLSSGMSFRLLLQTLHDEEIVSDDAILAWSNERKSNYATTTTTTTTTTGNNNTQQQQLEYRRQQLYQLQPIQDFLQWLEEEDDDDDDDDEDDENDDEDDE